MDAILKKDIVIPAGTRFVKAPALVRRAGDGHVSTVFGWTKDSSGEVVYFIDPLDSGIADWFEVE